MSFKSSDFSPLGIATEFYRAYTMSFTYADRAEKETAYEHRTRQCPSCSSTELLTCAEPGCKVVACESHLWRCEAHGDTEDTAKVTKRYCEDHLVWTELVWDANGPVGTDPVCFACMKVMQSEAEGQAAA